MIMDGMKEEMFPSSRTSQGSSGRLITAALIICCLISLVALILSAVSLSNKGTTNVNVSHEISNSGAVDSSSKDKVWTFAIGHDGTNLEYIDEISGTIRGFHVDIVNEVCEIANKNCV